MRRLRDGILARGDNPKAEMPFLDHLEELRWRILWSLLAVIVGAGIGLGLVHYFQVIELLIAPAREIFGEEYRLIYLAPTGGFFLYLQVSLTVGFLLAFPIIAYHVWGFFSPALEKREKRAIVPALYMGLVLFLIGVALAYFFALPITLRFLVGFQTGSLLASYTAPGYIGFVVKLLLAFGIVFELPVVVLVLSVLGVVTPRFLRTKRRHAVVGMLVVASLISPGDAINITIILMVPLMALYEFSILLSVMVWRKRDRAEREADPTPPEDSVATDDDAVSEDASPYGHGDPARGDTDLKPEDQE